MPKLKSSNATFSLIFKQCAQLLPLYGSTPCGDRSNGSFVMLDVTLWACSIYKRIQRCIPPLFCDTHFRKQQVTNLETKMYLRIGKNVRQFRSSQLQARYSWSFPKGMKGTSLIFVHHIVLSFSHFQKDYEANGLLDGRNFP